MKAGKLTSPSLAWFNNLSFTATVAAGSKEIVITLLGENGSALSTTNRTSIKYIPETLTSTVPVTVDSVAATTLTIPSGATLGFTANETGRFYLWGINNAGENVLGVARTADLWPESNLVTTVAIGTGSDLATAMYSTEQLTSKACRCIGYVEALTGATPGEWPDNAIKKCVVMHNGVKRTGDVVQTVFTTTGVSATGNTVIPYDDTIPQITEGNEYMTLAVTPSSALNYLYVEADAQVYMQSAGAVITMALFKDAVANALGVKSVYVYVSVQQVVSLSAKIIAGGVSEITFRVRMGCHDGNTMTFNIGALFNDMIASTIKITEVMA